MAAVFWGFPFGLDLALVATKHGLNGALSLLDEGTKKTVAVAHLGMPKTDGIGNGRAIASY